MAPVIENTETGTPTIKIPVSNQQISNAKKAGWETTAGLFFVDDGKVATVHVGCRYEYKNDTLYFSPHQALAGGQTYEVQVFLQKDTLKSRFTIPPNMHSNTVPEVLAVYPTASVIPSNILMFHVVFSSPMNEDFKAYKEAKLLDENGTEKKMVWREKSNWDDSGKHLVLMLHPGRVKRGINYFKNEGELFEKGKKYTLVITDKLKSKYNTQLGSSYTKTFTITNPDREIPKVTQQLVSPAMGSLDTLTIPFNEAMDYGTLITGVEVRDTKDNKIEGKIMPVNDKTFKFIPAVAWQNTAYTLVLNDIVTDLASNHLQRRFEEEDLAKMKNRNPVLIQFQPK